MEDYIKTLKFIPSEGNLKFSNDQFELILLNMEGIRKVTRLGNKLSIEFNTYIHSEYAMIELMKDNGYDPVTVEEKKGFFSKWLDKMAKNNKENFGGNRLDCCDLSK